MKIYHIRKFVFCDLIDERCDEEQPYNIPITPNCSECEVYLNYKVALKNKKKKEEIK